METNNSTVNYILNQDIDCSTFTNFSPISTFRGSLSGEGYSVYNLSIITTSSYTGLFSSGAYAIVKNISFIDFYVESNLTNLALLFAQCDYCSIDFVVFNTSTPSRSNIINGTAISTATENVGGFIAYGSDCNITNSIIQNTIINAPNHCNVGPFVANAAYIEIINCHNLGFPSNPNTQISIGDNSVGGLVGYGRNGLIFNSGVSNGAIFQTNTGSATGGLVGYVSNLMISQSYVKSSVSVYGNQNIGGFIGYISDSELNQTISNSYSKANVNGSLRVGGFVGRLRKNIVSLLKRNLYTFLFQNSYTSGNVNCSDRCGSFIGDITDLPECSFNNVYYDDSFNSSLPPFGSGNCPDLSEPSGFNCSTLYLSVLASFNDSNIWNGDNLKNEIPPTYGSCTCLGGCGFTTQVPSTLIPSTFAPSTITPSTITPSTITPSTISPSTLIPSTFTPSTTFPSTTPPSTNIPSTNVPSTFSPNCLYKVPNCENCGMRGISVDQSLFNISCILNVNNVWGYSFTPLFTNTTTIISQATTLNSTTSLIRGNFETRSLLTLYRSYIFVEGNFNQTFDSNIIIFVTPDSYKDAAFNVSGCVTVNGNISLVVEEKFPSGVYEVPLIYYNCSQQISFSEEKLGVTPTYKNNKCDKVGSKVNNQQNTLSASLSSTLGSNCKGLSTGAIIGIVLGVVGGAIIAIVIISLIFWKNRKDFNDKLSQVDTEMQGKVN